MRLGDREEGTARYKEALQATEASLAARAVDREPLEWASSQESLGLIYSRIFERDGEKDALRKAADAYAQALKRLFAGQELRPPGRRPRTISAAR